MAESTYDAIIIGAGIGGLVCGCYLAKAGMKVLICEQHSRPGGYCTSFKRQGFTFDAAAHCFGGYRENGITRKVFHELGIDKKISVRKSDPSDIVMTPEHKVSYWADLDHTIEDFQSAFPKERDGIKDFFSFLVSPDPQFFTRIRSWTLQDLLDRYFSDSKLKALLSAPLLGLGGLPPSLMSAFVGVKLFSEFLLDGGYHPTGGMQSLPDALAKQFKEFGGKLLLSCPVQRILANNRQVTGITVAQNVFIPSRNVISACDARQTFVTLIGKENIEPSFYRALQSMRPSISNFVAYLGLDNHFKALPRTGSTICFFSHYDLLKAYRAIERGNLETYGGFMFYISEKAPTVLAIVPTPYRTKSYWAKRKPFFLDSFINRLEKCAIPHLTRHLVYKEAATPHTLQRYTLNYRGASFGWAGTPAQLAKTDFRKPSFMKGLFLTGHWTTQGLGISGVVYVGQDTAKMLLRKEKR